MAETSKLNTAWEKLFQKYQILDQIDTNGTFRVTADQIKEFREPRLMTKFDWSSDRPILFQENQLSILPDSRGTYVIGRFDAYADLRYKEIKPIRVKLPDWVKSFDQGFPITSESVALNLAQMSGMIGMVMGVEPSEPEPVSTITGRLKSGQLDYMINLKGNNNPYAFQVNNSQVEIDAGFESLNKLAIIEAKNRIPKDFMIRQLYYPYRGYDNLGTEKEVLPIYMTHADDVYGFHIFKFEEKGNYSSIKKVKQLNFIIDQDLDITLEELKSISQHSPNLPDPDYCPSPQADSFTRILDAVDYLAAEPKDKFEFSEAFMFDDRQGDYYGNALVFLGLAEKENGKFKLTAFGNEISALPNNNNRNRRLIAQIISVRSFNIILEDVLRHNGQFNNELIDATILKYAHDVNSLSTAKRRRSTIKGWIGWILSVTNHE